MFTGCHDEIKSFLREFKEMTNLYNVPTTERFDLVTRYVSRQVSEVIEGIIEYHSKHWPDFVTQMKKLYNHAKTEKRYTNATLMPSSPTSQPNLFMTYQPSGSTNVGSYALEDGSCNIRRSRTSNSKNPFGWEYPNTFVIALKLAYSKFIQHSH